MPQRSKKARDIMPGEVIDLEEWFSENYDENVLNKEIEADDGAGELSADATLFLRIQDEFAEVLTAETRGGLRYLTTDQTSLIVPLDYRFELDVVWTDPDDEEIT